MKVLISPSMIEDSRRLIPDIEWVSYDYFTDNAWLIKTEDSNGNDWKQKRKRHGGVS